MVDLGTAFEMNAARKRRRLADAETEVSERQERDVQLGLPRRSRRRLCPHCKEEVSLKTFKFHKRLYYNRDQDHWCTTTLAKGQDMNPSSDEDSAPDTPLSLDLEGTQEYDDSTPATAPQVPSFVDLETESDSSELDEDNVEVWNEDEEDDLLSDLKLSDSVPPTDSQLDSVPVESQALSKWVLLFLMFIQATYKLSNTVVSILLHFFHAFLTVLGRFSPIASGVAQCLPSSLYMAGKLGSKLNFRKYVVCRKCHRIYHMAKCLDGTTQTSKACSFKPFPMHPHHSMRRSCGTLLLKTVELAGGRTYFYPFLTFCYVSLDQSLQHLLECPDFYNQCELWRSRKNRDGVFCDVYDGNVWKNFQSYNDRPLLSEPGNFAVMMNMDFFQPYKHVQYSMGAIYLTVLNLPCGIRSKQENTILVGLIPGPHEPRHDINTFLEPFVDDLLRFWNGIELNVADLKCRKLIRCVLLCVACDIPAGRKVCGFLGHNAHLGCSRCFKRFSGTVGAMNFSGFDRDNWPCRTGPKHREDALSLLCIRTKTDLQKAESELGCRYSVLLKLPYFNAPRMLIVDPMHNLFLGAAKHFLKSILVGHNIISETDFVVIQDRVDSIVVPSDIGRIPHKILSGFSSFTADQWKNWVIYYSLIALHDILSTDILECWRHFVLACRVLCSKEINMEQVMLGDALLLHFCRRTERIFGEQCVTPNMHLSCHLRSCIVDYGPLHGFWCYAFERYNGILGSMPNNNRSIEIQLAGRFLRESHSISAPHPVEFAEYFEPLLSQRTSIGSIAETLSAQDPLQECDARSCWTIDSSSILIKMPVYCSRGTLTSTEKSHLLQLYCKIYSVSDHSNITMSTTYMRYSYVLAYGKQLGSYKSRSASSSTVMVSWDTNWFGACSGEAGSDIISRAARINYFCKHSVTVNGINRKHLLVNLSWFLYHPKHTVFGKPITVWYNNLFEPCGSHTLVPVQLIKCRSVSLVDKLDDEDVYIVVPCIGF